MFRWPPDGDAYLRVQRVAEGNGGVHLDLPVDPAAGAVEHAASGAQIVSVFPDWTAMADPTGRPYCLTGRDPETGKPPHA